jgi:hypothetical protein
MQRLSDGENPAPKLPVGFNLQETFTEHDKTRNVKNRIGIQIVELNPVRKEEAMKKRVREK